MPRVRSVDGSPGISFEGRWVAPPSLPVCEPAQVLDGGEGRSADNGNPKTQRETRPEWPFLYSYRGDTILINKATPKSKYQEACAAGVALF